MRSHGDSQQAPGGRHPVRLRWLAQQIDSALTWRSAMPPRITSRAEEPREFRGDNNRPCTSKHTFTDQSVLHGWCSVSFRMLRSCCEIRDETDGHLRFVRPSHCPPRGVTQTAHRLSEPLRRLGSGAWPAPCCGLRWAAAPVSIRSVYR